jgi:hypothetical protein
MRSMRTTLTALALAVVAGALAGPLAAQQTPVERIEAAMERARAAGLPVEILENKRAEGQAKNIPADRIAAVIERRAAALERANQAISRARDGRPTMDELAVGTDAIEAGVSEAVLERIAATAGGERRTVAIAALAYLVDSGIMPDVALARVEEALARGGDALANLPGMAQGRGRMGPPAGVPPAGRPAGVGRPDAPPRGGPPGGTPPGRPPQ